MNHRDRRLYWASMLIGAATLVLGLVAIVYALRAQDWSEQAQRAAVRP